MVSDNSNQYPGVLTPDMEPFDPLKLARLTQGIVCRGDARKYTRIYCVGVYGGISTAYAVGCCMKCAFCWVGWGRDDPEHYGKFYTPKQVFDRLVENARRKRISKLRISGGEPTLCKEHLLGVLDLVKETDYHFILETNGIIFGSDREYVRALKKYENVHTRVSLKAGTGEGFQRRTGARGDSYELPFKAIEYLMEAGVSFHVAAMTDPALMPEEERQAMITRLKDMGYADFFEEEGCDPYPTSVARLKAAGFDIFK